MDGTNSEISGNGWTNGNGGGLDGWWLAMLSEAVLAVVFSLCMREDVVLREDFKSWCVRQQKLEGGTAGIPGVAAVREVEQRTRRPLAKVSTKLDLGAAARDLARLVMAKGNAAEDLKQQRRVAAGVVAAEGETQRDVLALFTHR
ncbi:hypothetical protein NL676_009098 [Syzygium grande]|nr:hypothetical protein NL676_009098 [Syzygium grande]